MTGEFPISPWLIAETSGGLRASFRRLPSSMALGLERPAMEQGRQGGSVSHR
jgi:hypothetical protein